MSKVEGVERATGRSRAEWFSVLDAWEAKGRPYREIADWLIGEHGLSRWWAQKLIVEYEQDRGVRQPGARRNGTFEVGASKTVAVSATHLYTAFIDSRRRNKWLTDGKMKLDASKANRSARFVWEDGSSRVNVDFTGKGRSKATVTVTHDRITDPAKAQALKTDWRKRLTELKSFLES
ncbi:MAG TPA: DUF4287 domain-containing protein [Actinomycetota bacterium]|nr:DUF4287 domain-containing protein [Actinomycetota bacterium]